MRSIVSSLSLSPSLLSIFVWLLCGVLVAGVPNPTSYLCCSTTDYSLSAGNIDPPNTWNYSTVEFWVGIGKSLVVR